MKILIFFRFFENFAFFFESFCFPFHPGAPLEGVPFLPYHFNHCAAIGKWSPSSTWKNLNRPVTSVRRGSLKTLKLLLKMTGASHQKWRKTDRKDLSIILCVFSVLVCTLRVLIRDQEIYVLVTLGSTIPSALLFLFGIYLKVAYLLLPFILLNCIFSGFLFVQTFRTNFSDSPEQTLLGLYRRGLFKCQPRPREGDRKMFFRFFFEKFTFSTF